MSRIRIGISGWTFPAWRGTFYPKSLTRKRELEYASRQLTSIEINGTFYRLQKAETFQSWHDQTPPGFTFAVKAPQYITHVRRLKEVEDPLERFISSGLLELKEKLGPVLWQFPPNVMLKDDRFEKFVKCLVQYPIRSAFELRHKSFFCEEFRALLKEHNIAFVFAHAKKGLPYDEIPTADFVYLRLHGEAPGLRLGYPPKEISSLAKKITAWSRGKTGRRVFAYFSEDAKARSPIDALSLMKRLNEVPVEEWRLASTGT